MRVTEQKGYDILRMIETGSRCYEVMDYKRGKLMFYYIKQYPNISKRQLFQWIHELIKQLDQYYLCRANPYYRYLSPYSILVLENQKLALLDLKVKENLEFVSNVQLNKLQQCFILKEQFNKSKIQSDIYSLGKTLQYILAKTIVDPKLSKREEIQLTKIIEKCTSVDSKYRFQNIRQILNEGITL